jgi:nitroimidazol reductase NimA-like FMN-containing flavoprotein (pyridoxamine 5'-phosphate oxidase superfamily)
MRPMTHDEIRAFITSWTWGTLIGIEANRPYAVELSYGTDGRSIFCGSRPGGRMARCISANPAVAFKICDSDRSYSSWKAVIIEGIAERQTEYDDILNACRHIARQRGFDERAFDRIAQKIAGNPDGNSLRIPIETVSGVMSGG